MKCSRPAALLTAILIHPPTRQVEESHAPRALARSVARLVGGSLSDLALITTINVSTAPSTFFLPVDSRSWLFSSSRLTVVHQTLPSPSNPIRINARTLCLGRESGL